MRIGVYYRSFAFHGGGPRVAASIAKSLAQLNHQPVILTNEYDANMWPDLRNIDVIRMKVNPFPHTIFHEMDYVADTLYLFARNIRKLDAIVLTGMYVTSPFIKILAKKPLILYIHCAICSDWTINQTVRHAVKGFEKQFYSSADHLLCNSKLTQKALKSQLDLDSEVLYPPVDTEYFKPENSKEENLIVSICRLVPKKESEQMIYLFQNFISGDYRFILAGGVEKTHKKYAEQLAKLAAHDNRVSLIFNPSGEEIKRLYQRATVFWYIYPREDFGLSVAEAMSSGTPVVVMKGGGLKEIVTEETGFTVQSRNELIKHTLFLLKHPEKCRQMGISARNRVVANFSEAIFTKKLERILERL
jgi:glycosyltransferase involved in cell wall biosynthesis